MAQAEEFFRAPGITLKKYSKDYEVLRKKPEEESPYSTFTTNDYEDLRKQDGTYTNIGFTGFGTNQKDGMDTSPKSVAPARRSVNRKKIGLIAAISVGLIVVIAVAVILVYVHLDQSGTNVPTETTETTRPATQTTTISSISSTETESDESTSVPTETTETTKPATQTTTISSISSTETESDESTSVPTETTETTKPATQTTTISSISSTETESDESTSVPTETTKTTKPATQTTTISSLSSTETASAESTSGPNNQSWSNWGQWTQCTVTCDNGFQVRYRNCNEKLSSMCEGSFVERRLCSRISCPVIGKWTTWSSWGSCDVTCGGGSHIRNRTCIKSDEFDKDCSGETFQQKTCSNWTCPDCHQICTVGVLNDRCDTCICDNNYITGQVLAKATGNPVIGAALYARTAPTQLLALSNSTGFFSLNATCSATELYITKEGFIDTTVTVNDIFTKINLKRIVKPFLTKTPQSKYRLSDENVTFCCKASANPEITYYEWFKDNIILDRKLYTNETQLLLTFLNYSDSGNYQCRANSGAGAIMSPVAVLTVRDEPGEFCSDALQHKTIQLPDECMHPGSNTSAFDVGECLAKKCRAGYTTLSGTCGEEKDSCCSVKEYQVETINCTDYELDMVVVKSCGCASCTPLEVTISGVATGLENGTPVRFASVYLNGEMKGRTSTAGSFEFTVNSTRSRWTITIEDDINKYFLPASKVIEIFDDSNGLINVEIKMIKASDPVEIDSTIENTLRTGTASGFNVSNVLFDIPANAFSYRNGSKYIGTVNARLTYLDPLNTSIVEDIPGLFQYVDNEGFTGDLISMGVFNLYFEDKYGHSVELDQDVHAYIPKENGENETYEDFKLWTMNSQTGIWELEEENTDRRRKRRQTDDAWVGALADVSKQKWYNYDKVDRLSDNLCYFKIRLFKDKSQTVPDYSSNSITVSINIIRGRTLHTIKHYLYNPTSNCFNVPCDGEKAYISGKTSIQLLSVGKPQSSPSIDYSISSDETVLAVQLKSSDNGPFYSTRDLCTSVLSDTSYLSFSYDIKNYEWKFIDFPKKCDLNISQVDPLIRQRYWYPHSRDGYSVCFVNIKIQFKSGKDIHKEDMKLRVFSYGGYGSNIDGKILGIHESAVKGSQSHCLEYRCSGFIDTCDDSVSDKTKVKIILEYPKGILRCYIDGSANELENAYAYNHQNSDYTYFQFSAPYREFGTNAGIHFETKDKASALEAVKTNLKANCEASSGYAVSFLCE